MRAIITFSFAMAWILYVMDIRERWYTETGYLNPTMIKAVVIGSLLLIPICYFLGFIFPSLEGW